MNRAVQLVHKWSSDQLTPEEESELAALISSGDETSQHAFELLHLEAMLRGESLDLDVAESVVGEIQRHEADAAARRVLDRIVDKQRLPASAGRRRPSVGRPRFRMFAAAGAVLLVIAGVSWIFFRSASPQDRLVAEEGVKIETPDGFVEFDAGGSLPLGRKIATGENSQVRVKLQDGSDIELGRHTVFAVARDKTDLCVELTEGLMVAQVAKQRPGEKFAVRTPNLSVEVVGTRFSVAHDSGVSEVSVEEGAVDVVLSRTGEQTRLAAGEHLAASELGRVDRAKEGDWHDDFEGVTLGEHWVSGQRVETASAPAGNGSTVCLKAAEERDTYYNRDLLVARLSDERQGLVSYDDSLLASFRYYATPSCGWLGIWMQTATGEKYFLPIPATFGRWQTAEVPLRNAKSTSGDESKGITPGAVIQVIAIQTGRTQPDAAFFLDDLSIRRTSPSAEQ